MDLRSIGPKPYAWAGIAAATVMVMAIILCVLLDSNWTYDGRHSSMCDFGVSEFWYVSVIFIGACIVSGTLILISGFGWYLFEESKYIRYGGLVIMLAGIALMCVGIFDKTYSFHQSVTIIFAVIFIIGIALVSVQDIIDRDYRDMHREISPLKQADDAVFLDSSDMTIEEVKDKIIELYKGV